MHTILKICLKNLLVRKYYLIPIEEERPITNYERRGLRRKNFVFDLIIKKIINQLISF